MECAEIIGYSQAGNAMGLILPACEKCQTKKESNGNRFSKIAAE